jgi:hypothetical protein
MKTLAVLLFLLSCVFCHAGSADAVIKGRTGTGRTQLEIHVQDISGSVTYVKLTIDGKSLEIKNCSGKGVHQDVIYDPKNKVYTISLQSPEGSLKFWMIPKTQKITRGEYSEKWTFSAVVQGTDPRAGDDAA